MKSLKVLSALVLALTISAPSLASAASSCGDGGALNYSGKLSNAYVNSSGLILFYLAEDIPQSVINRCGDGATTRNRFAVQITAANAEAVKLMYSTALTAVATQANVSMGGRGRQGSAVRAVRISMSQP